MKMRIEDVEAMTFRSSAIDRAAQDPTQAVVLIRVLTDTGLIGLGECNYRASVVTAYLEENDGVLPVDIGIKPVLLGRDPAERATIMRDLFEANFYSARGGIGRGLLSAIDVALWDLSAQQRGEPLWQTLWGSSATHPTPYVTTYTGPGHISSAIHDAGKQIEVGLQLGYVAIKLEPMPENVEESEIPQFVEACRDRMGKQVEMYVDFGYRFHDPALTVEMIKQLAPYQPAFIEAPLNIDDLDGWRYVSTQSPIPIAGAELLESAFDYQAMIKLGGIDIAQPWVNRVGITGTLQVIKQAIQEGRRVVLAGFNTTAIGNLASIHVAAGLGDGVVMEHAPTVLYNFELRALVDADPIPVDGVIRLPTRPGLGAGLVDEAVDRYQVR